MIYRSKTKNMNNIPKGCKPFNLQECIEGKPVVTRDGKPYKFGAYNEWARAGFKLVGWSHFGELLHHRSDGRVIDDEDDHDNDLFMKAEIKIFYHAVFRFANGCINTTLLYDSIEKLQNECTAKDREIIKIYETEIEL